MRRVDWDRVLELGAQGLPTEQIAARCECSRDTVNRILRVHQAQRSTWVHVDRDRVVQLTAAGHSSTQIAAMLGCSRRSVVRLRSVLGIAGKPPRFLTPEEVERAEALLADGCSVREVERTLGRAPGSLSRRFAGRGWDRSKASSFALFCRYAEARTRPSNVVPIR